MESFRPPLHLNPGQWFSTPSLATVKARAMSRAGVYADNDPYSDQWAEWANAAREDLIAALTPICGAATQSEIALSINAAGLYDLTGYGVLRIDRVGIGSGTDITWLPWCNPSAAFTELGYTPTSDDWAGTQVFRAGGSVIGLAPVPTDTGMQVIVQGAMLPRPMILDVDSTGLPREMLNTLVSRVAWYCCDFDRADVQREKRIPGLERDFDRGVYGLKLRYLQRTPPVAGMATVYGVDEGDTLPGNRQQVGASLAPAGATVYLPEPVLRLKSSTVASTVGTAPLVIPCLDGYPVDADSLLGVSVFSEDQGRIANYTVSTDRMTITATLRTGFTWNGENVTAVYGSTGL